MPEGRAGQARYHAGGREVRLEIGLLKFLGNPTWGSILGTLQLYFANNAFRELAGKATFAVLRAMPAVQFGNCWQPPSALGSLHWETAAR